MEPLFPLDLSNLPLEWEKATKWKPRSLPILQRFLRYRVSLSFCCGLFRPFAIQKENRDSFPPTVSCRARTPLNQKPLSRLRRARDMGDGGRGGREGWVWDGIRRRYNGKMLLLHVACSPRSRSPARCARYRGALSFSAVSGHPVLKHTLPCIFILKRLCATPASGS